MEEIVTGEAVILDLPVARFPTRMLARVIDMVVQAVLFFAILISVIAAELGNSLDSAAVAAVLVTGLVVALVGYPVAMETLSRGRTLGKLALGLRVVADDGGPVRFRHSLVRGLTGAIECWVLFGVPALITSMLSARGKRLGDIFAGTFVVRERAPRPVMSAHQARAYAAGGYAAGGHPAGGYAAGGYTAGGYTAGGYTAGGYAAGGHAAGGYAGGIGPTGMPVEPSLRPWSATLDLSGLPDPLAASAASYLARYWQLDPRVRDQIGLQLASDVATRVSPPPPPGVPPVSYLNAVLAQRRDRELARLFAASPPPAVPPSVIPPSAGVPSPSIPTSAVPPSAGVPSPSVWAAPPASAPSVPPASAPPAPAPPVPASAASSPEALPSAAPSPAAPDESRPAPPGPPPSSGGFAPPA
ncbi:MAG TPA: RDD family protein [Trebonia sp.]|nr:RDD family protein [Trebonia sp.]